ncbi:hypothetical protein [Dethiothermospora halolimnae]|uniref:hypothetical protein n=1 Tax=Dethiothermospora halolimnae TaxID=3114390 RepID=UPI003CCB7F77
MKKNSYVIIIALALTFLIINMTHSKVYSDGKYVNELNKLLTKRIVTMNKGLYESDVDISAIKEELKKIEYGKLLKDDLEIIEYVRNNPTDYSYVTKAKIEESKLIDENENSLKVKIKVKWTFNSIEDEISANNYLIIDIVKEKGRYLMTNIVFINE